MNAIEVGHLYKSFKNTKAVNDLSFTVPVAKCYTILGPNGAGKTTSSRTLFSQVRPDKRTETSLSVFGHDPRVEPHKVKSMLGVVPQENNLDSDLNVEQNLMIYARFYGMYGRSATARIQELLEFMELRHKRTEQVKSLSGGMKRRLIIARALLNKPKLLILDEPTTGLDLQVRQLIWDRLLDLKKEQVTILLTTHYMEEALQLSDVIMIMHKGNKIVEDSPQTLLKSYIEPYVLVVNHYTATPTPPDSIRFQQVGARGHFYASSDTELAAYASTNGFKEYSIQSSSLDDVFIKSTGGSLNAQQ